MSSPVSTSNRTPLPLERRESTTGLTPVAERAVRDLELRRPQVNTPGHWSSESGDLCISTAVLKYALTRIDTPLRALLSFAPGDMEQKRVQLLDQVLPNRGAMNSQEVKRSWGKTLKIRAQARQQRVHDILQELSAAGVNLDPNTIEVHRVSNTFYANVTLQSLRRLQQLRSPVVPENTAGVHSDARANRNDSTSILKIRIEAAARAKDADDDLPLQQFAMI